MFRTLARAALAAAVVAPLAACSKPEPPPPPAPEPPDPAVVAQAAKEASYTKHFAAGTKALAAGDADAAVTNLKQAATDKPESVEAHLELGRALVAKKDDAAAVKAFTEALRLNPKLADAFFERAAVHERAGRLNDASFDYRQIIALEVDPKTTARAYWLRGAVADRLGKRDDYRYDRERALELDPDYQSRVTAGDVRVNNHSATNVKIKFDAFVNPDGTAREFPSGFAFTVPGNNTFYLLDGNRHLPARSVRYTVTTANGSKTFEQAYEKGMTFEIHIHPGDLPTRG